MYLKNYFAKIACSYYYVSFLPNHCGEKNQTKIVIVKNNIAIRIAGKVSRYIDASMNRATPNVYHNYCFAFDATCNRSPSLCSMFMCAFPINFKIIARFIIDRLLAVHNRALD